MTRAKNVCYSHVIGFDDMPIAAEHRGDRLECVLHGRVRRDGANATRALAELVEGSRCAPRT